MIGKLRDENFNQHEQLLIHQKETNGKVKLNRWIATTALTLILSSITLLVGFFFKSWAGV